MEPNKNALIVDGMNLAFRWKHQGKLDFKQDYINTVKSLAQSYDCSKIIIAGDQGSSALENLLILNTKRIGQRNIKIKQNKRKRILSYSSRSMKEL